jgi:hypothetical protein
MFFVADAPRFADRKDTGGLSRIAGVLPRNPLRRHGPAVAAAGGFWVWGSEGPVARWPALHGPPQPVSGPPIAESRELCPEKPASTSSASVAVTNVKHWGSASHGQCPAQCWGWTRETCCGVAAI